MISIDSLIDFALVTVPSVLGATAFWNYLSKRQDKKSGQEAKTQLSDGLKKIATIYGMMGELENFGAQRVILFAGHNGGGIPRVTCGFWTSGIFSYYSSKYQDKAQQYNNIPVDGEYVNMLIECQQRPYIRYITKDMAPGQLQKLYSAEGVVDSVIFSLGIHEQKFMYISVASYEEEFTDNELTYIELHIQNIKTLFDKL